MMFGRSACIFPVFSVLFVIVVASWLAQFGEPCEVGDKFSSSIKILELKADSGLTSKILLAHLSWTLTTQLFIIACLGGIGICWYISACSLAHYKGWIRAIVPLGVFVTAGLAHFLTSKSSPLLEHRVMLELNRKMLHIIGNTNVFLVDQLVNWLIWTAIFFLLAAACCILAEPADNDRNGPKQLSAQMRRLKIVIYIGAVQLISGALNSYSQYRWPTVLAEKQAVSYLKELAASFSSHKFCP